MKPAKSLSKEDKTTGRFSTAEEAALAKNAGVVASLKKMNFKVVATHAATERVR